MTLWLFNSYYPASMGSFQTKVVSKLECRKGAEDPSMSKNRRQIIEMKAVRVASFILFRTTPTASTTSIKYLNRHLGYESVSYRKLDSSGFVALTCGKENSTNMRTRACCDRQCGLRICVYITRN